MTYKKAELAYIEDVKLGYLLMDEFGKYIKILFINKKSDKITIITSGDRYLEQRYGSLVSIKKPDLKSILKLL